MPTNATPKPSNLFTRILHGARSALGFTKTYNALLWFTLAGAMLGFCLARAPYLAFDTVFRTNAAPGEWFYFRHSFYRFGMILHLSAVVPAGVLAAVQFVPVVRHKALIFHRVNGYAIILLVMLANASGLMIARRTFGGTLETQVFVGVLAISTTTCIALAYVSIKRLHIARHRAWMLRCWAYLGTPITTRLVMVLVALIVGRINSYYMAVPCAQIDYTATDQEGNATFIDSFAACRENPDGWTAVKADMYNPKSVIEAMAGLQIGFGTAGMLSFLLHAVAVEVYLGLTPAESERLRRVSFERRVERGWEKEEAKEEVKVTGSDGESGIIGGEESRAVTAEADGGWR